MRPEEFAQLLAEVNDVREHGSTPVNPLDPHLDLLGRSGRDRVTGFEGVITSISFDLYGCIQVAVCPRVDKDGKLLDGKWLDVHRIEPIGIEGSRSMPVPNFTMPPAFGATPQTHQHGPAEKPDPTDATVTSGR
jgi:hypothetical protein